MKRRCVGSPQRELSLDMPGPRHWSSVGVTCHIYCCHGEAPQSVLKSRNKHGEDLSFKWDISMRVNRL